MIQKTIAVLVGLAFILWIASNPEENAGFLGDIVGGVIKGLISFATGVKEGTE